MNSGMKNLFCLLLLCLAGGCRIADKGVVDTTAPPFVGNASASPSFIDVTHLGLQPTSPIDTTIVFSASVDTGSSSALVTYTLLDPEGNVLLSGTLTDFAGKFSASTPFHILKQDVGTYGVQFQARAVNDAENRSNTLSQTIVVKNNDHSPIVNDIVMADTVSIPPTGDTTFLKITVAVSDSDGIQDIAGVSFTSRRPDNSIVAIYPMFDDGNLTPANLTPFGLKSGDAVAGDGIYTLTIPLTSSTTGNTYRDFSFMATDRSGESSNVLTKRIFIK
jgi:hypothetical protein